MDEKNSTEDRNAERIYALSVLGVVNSFVGAFGLVDYAIKKHEKSLIMDDINYLRTELRDVVEIPVSLKKSYHDYVVAKKLLGSDLKISIDGSDCDVPCLENRIQDQVRVIDSIQNTSQYVRYESLKTNLITEYVNTPSNNLQAGVSGFMIGLGIAVVYLANKIK